MNKSIPIGIFQFKQFHVSHHKSTLKVGTDAVLLGTWASHPHPQKILDIGTGNGVIALLMAQRFQQANIRAVDIDVDSVEEATSNFIESPWSSRLRAIHQDVQNFAKLATERFDMIVSNPPFFENDLHAQNEKLNKAKHSNTLNYKSLFHAADQLLKENGIFALICPYDKKDKVIEIASFNRLFCKRQLCIYPKKTKQANRIIIEFCHSESVCENIELVIYTEDNTYTSQYKKLGQDYYINF